MELVSVPNTQMKNISYLRARDPSIIAWNNHLSDVRVNLNDVLLEETACSVAASQDNNLLKVYLRIKKSENFKDLYEVVDGKTLLCKVPEGAQCIRNVRDGSVITKTFTFSNIFGSQSTQSDLFNGVVKAKVLQFINGSNCSLLTYGASGSGKTFTIVGTADEPGIVPRALEYLFRTLPQLPDQPLIKPTASGGVLRLTESHCEIEKAFRQSLLKGSTVNVDHTQHTRMYKAMQQRLSQEPVALITDDLSGVSLGVWVSFAEIYNEYVYDLLKPEPPRGRLRQKLRLGYSNGNAYIKDLSCVSVSSGLDAYHILQYGLHNLKYAATSLNDHSSRSHSIFTIKLAQASDKQEGVNVSLFNFCDLAGSERVKKTNNVGERLKESNNINTSLLVLGRCVSLVRECQKQNTNKPIPFRESKLTQLFQNALLGRESISMIVNINPTRQMFDESQHVLNFSAIAKDVIIEQPQLVKYPKNNRFSQYMENKNNNLETAIEESEIQELQEQIELLYNELQQQKLDSEENKQYVINTYKKLLEETNKYWEDRCQNLENTWKKRSKEIQEKSLQKTKKRKLSVIVLNSSSELEDDNNEDNEAKEKCKDTLECTKDTIKKKCDDNNNLLELQSELTQTKLQLQTEAVNVLKLTEEIKSLKESLKDAKDTLKDAKEAYLELQSKYENDSKELNLEILQKQDKINELNNYLQAIHKVKDVGYDAQEDKENGDSCNSNTETWSNSAGEN